MSEVLKAMVDALESTIITILAAFAALLKFPEWTEEESVHQWALKLVAAGNTVTPLIPGTIDDKFVNGLARITASEETFRTLYEILLDMINQGTDGSVLRADPRVTSLAAKVGLPITTILAIAAFLYQLYLKWLAQHPTEAA